jgi:two-component system response regulator FlrC
MQGGVGGVHIGPVKIIGQSPGTLAMLNFAYMAASSEASVLLEGESGTGKELMAQAIHFASTRAVGPFVAVNCGAINPNLIESELFGHEQGAFTGAVRRKFGRFERANRGTLFLDEVGELSLPDQVKLLRALQERRIERVGGTEEIEVDIRIIAATNRDLWAAVEAGGFRQDLYYRLAVLNFFLPSLRDRADDILPLAQHFLALHSERTGKRVPKLTPEADATLLGYDWPGNVRELRNVIERALVLANGDEIDDESLIFRPKSKATITSAMAAPPSSLGARPLTIEVEPLPRQYNGTLLPPGVEFDDLALPERRRLIRQALQQCRGNRTNAAELLGLSSRFQLYRLMKKLGINNGAEN